MNRDDFIQALNGVRPGSQWNLIYSDKENIDIQNFIWLDNIQVKPTLQEIKSFSDQIQQDAILKSQLLEQAKATLNDKAATTDDKLTALIKVLGFS